MRKAEAKLRDSHQATLEVGQVVDEKYRVDHLVGTGGMAEVWACTNERTRKRVALKVLLQSLAAAPAAQALFHSEGLAASRVNHPNVVTIFDVIEHRGMACIVMELLDGETLGRYIARNGCLSAQEAAWLLLPAMRGVAAAHAQGVIHRDLKPQNIFLCIGPDGRVVTTKVLDFGISVIVERALASSPGETTGVAMGTPGYMAPEHLSGMPVDGRCDVYGFGGLLYESLTGQMAFPGEPESELFERILNLPPPSLALLRPDLSPGLVRIIETAMSKHPDDRYSDMDRMVSALETEVMPASAPRSLTPLVGMAVNALADPLSRPPDPAAPIQMAQEQSVRHQISTGPEVQAVLNREPSGQYQETKMLFGLPLNTEDPSSASGDVQPDDLADQAPELPTASRDSSASKPQPRDTVVLKGRDTFLQLIPRSGWFLAVRGWRGVVGASTVAVLVFAVWLATRGPEAARPVAPSVAPATLPTVVSIPVARPEVAAAPSPAQPNSPSALAPPEVSAPTETNKSTNHSQTGHGSSSHTRSRAAVRDSQNPSSPRRSSRAPTEKENQLPPSAQASGKTTSPRAGTLSADDF